MATDDQDIEAASPPRGNAAKPWIIVGLCSIAALVIGVLLINRANEREATLEPGKVASVDDPRAAVDYEYVIPEGTGARVEAGENVNVIPDQLVVKVGETMRIVNNDTVGHIVGPFFVGKHQTLTQRFSKVGTIVGECSVHPSTRIEIDVTR